MSATYPVNNEVLTIQGAGQIKTTIESWFDSNSTVDPNNLEYNMTPQATTIESNNTTEYCWATYCKFVLEVPETMTFWKALQIPTINGTPQIQASNSSFPLPKSSQQEISNYNNDGDFVTSNSLGPVVINWQKGTESDIGAISESLGIEIWVGKFLGVHTYIQTLYFDIEALRNTTFTISFLSDNA